MEGDVDLNPTLDTLTLTRAMAVNLRTGKFTKEAISSAWEKELGKEIMTKEMANTSGSTAAKLAALGLGTIVITAAITIAIYHITKKQAAASPGPHPQPPPPGKLPEPSPGPAPEPVPAPEPPIDVSTGVFSASGYKTVVVDPMTLMTTEFAVDFGEADVPGALLE